MYNQYSDYVKVICDTNNLSNFKSNPNYTYMLEHVNTQQGNLYLNCILYSTNISVSEIENFCMLNDKIGNPIKVKYDNLSISVSPTSLRYILHAHLILSHMKRTNSENVIELGGGYGGLCFALHNFSNKYGVNINSYTICDLPNIICLQNKYLNIVTPNLNVNFAESTNFGEDIKYEQAFLISNYCFSEISNEYQQMYINKMFKKIKHGFMAWNNIPIYDFGFKLNVEPEIPETGPRNKYVYF
jgi:putative sugar O-methyltransferase